MSPAVKFSKQFIVITAVAGMVSVSIILFLAKRVEAARAEFATAQQMLDLYRSEIWHIQKTDRQDLEKRLVSQLAKFTNPNEIPLILDEIFKLGVECNIHIESAIPKNLSDEQKVIVGGVDAFRKIQIEMKIQGGYNEISNFLDRLNTLPKGVIAVETFSMAANPPNQGSLNLSAVLDVFVKISPEQNILDLKASESSNGTAMKSRSLKIGRSPFSEIVQSESNDINIEGIIYDPVTPMVLVNGDVHKEGDVVSGMRIVKILQNSVQFEKNGKKLVKELVRS